MEKDEKINVKSVPKDAVVKGPNKIVPVRKLPDDCAG